MQAERMTETGIPGWLLFGIMVVCIVGIAVLRLAYTSDLLLALDNDSAMRLVQVRDLMAGQGWFNLNQYRLGADLPVEMHWSRLIDGPMVALILFFDLLADGPAAELALLVVWPCAWLAVTFWATLKISAHFGEPSPRPRRSFPAS